MSTSSEASLGALRIQAKYRADLENNQAVTDSEWNGYISQSYKELYDLLVAAYGNDYHVATSYSFTTTNSQQYTLPDGTPTFVNNDGGIARKFYKLLGVDLQYSASPSGFISLKRMEFIERNRLGWPNVAVNWNGYTNLRYRIEGNSLFLIPVPQTGQQVKLWYIPAPTSLQYMLPGYSVLSSNTIGSLSDTTGVTVGMNIFSPSQGVLSNNSTVTGVSTTTMTISSNALSNTNANIFSMWSDSTTFDGISGWEEYVIIDAAIKAQIKQEGPHEPLVAQKRDMLERIASMSEGRDAGQAQHVSDVLSISGYSSGFSDDGGGWGGF